MVFKKMLMSICGVFCISVGVMHCSQVFYMTYFELEIIHFYCSNQTKKYIECALQYL